MTGRFYIYEHWRPDKDMCFYVGKGSGRRIKKHSREWNTHHGRILKKLERLGMCVEVRLVAGGLTEENAFIMEIERIAFWRGAGIKLTNQTAGGEGCTKPSLAVREKMRLAKLGKPQSPENAHRSRTQNIGKKMPAEAVERVRLLLTGRVHTKEAVANMRAAQLANPTMPSHIEKLRLLNTGRKQTEEHKAKVKAALLGIKRTPETRARMREAALTRNMSPDGLIRMQTACLGKKASAETKAKMRARHAERRVKKLLLAQE